MPRLLCSARALGLWSCGSVRMPSCTAPLRGPSHVRFCTQVGVVAPKALEILGFCRGEGGWGLAAGGQRPESGLSQRRPCGHGPERTRVVGQVGVCVVWAPQRQPSALQPRSRSRVHEPAHSLLPALASLRVARDREMYGYSKSQCIKS